MKYMIMVYGSQQDYDVVNGKPTGKPAKSPEDIAKAHAFILALHAELAEEGVLVDGRGLAAPVHTRRLHLRGGAPVVTDGPYPETQEVLAGFTVVECPSYDHATKVAARFLHPDGLDEYVDVRPVIEGYQHLDDPIV
ncbi:hypothetical protein BJF78_07640 [Pseudonocardia sp. CNS-139]|nr:hypothetical protein BJF78_07640 [Pseudonocardia sp. CNS-139]